MPLVGPSISGRFEGALGCIRKHVPRRTIFDAVASADSLSMKVLVDFLSVTSLCRLTTLP